MCSPPTPGFDGMRLALWPLEPASGARNMALDEAAMASARAGRPVLRFYTWAPHCLSLGRNQPTSEHVGTWRRSRLTPGEDVVRRPTGGRSVFHGPELTYALAVPDRFLGGPRAIHAAFHAALGAGLRELGVDVDPARPGAAPAGPTGLDGAGCFVAPAPGEITSAGRKLVGSAQWRHGHAVLQHGSILIRDEQDRAGIGAGTAVGLAELVPDPPELEVVAEVVANAFVRACGAKTTASHPTGEVLERAGDLERKYRSPGWTWRR